MFDLGTCGETRIDRLLKNVVIESKRPVRHSMRSEGTRSRIPGNNRR
jgi:hypothetical protein